MRSKSSMLILVIGIIGFGVMGFLMKFTVESNPSLMELGKVKQALADGYSDRGLEEVQVRALPRRRGYDVRASFESFESEQKEDLARDLAGGFVETYKGTRKRKLKVTLLQVRTWGCGGPSVVYEKEFDIPALLRELQIRKQLEAVAGQRHPRVDLEVTGASLVDPRTVRIEFTAASVPDEPTPEEVEQLFGEAREFVWTSFRTVPVRWVVLVLRSTRDLDPILKEAKIERPGLSRPRMFHPPPRPASPPAGER